MCGPEGAARCGEACVMRMRKIVILCLMLAAVLACAAGCSDRAEAPEEERRIAGAFMVGEEFVGSLCRDGVIQSHPQHRLYLEEAQRPLFWPYVVGDSAAQRWGKAAFKYFSSQAGQRILYDLAASLAGGEHGQQAEAFYQYFCQVNRLRRRSAAQGTAKPEER